MVILHSATRGSCTQRCLKLLCLITEHWPTLDWSMKISNSRCVVILNSVTRGRSDTKWEGPTLTHLYMFCLWHSDTAPHWQMCNNKQEPCETKSCYVVILFFTSRGSSAGSCSVQSVTSCWTISDLLQKEQGSDLLQNPEPPWWETQLWNDSKHLRNRKGYRRYSHRFYQDKHTSVLLSFLKIY